MSRRATRESSLSPAGSGDRSFSFTSEQHVARARQLMSEVGMTVIDVQKEVEGFVYNRLQGALLRGAYCLVRDGVVEPEDIDKIVHDGIGVVGQ